MNMDSPDFSDSFSPIQNPEKRITYGPPPPIQTRSSSGKGASERVNVMTAEKLASKANQLKEAEEHRVITAAMIRPLTSDRIRKMGFKIDTKSGSDEPGGINDAAGGVTQDCDLCKTCNSTNEDCPGHMGYISFPPEYRYVPSCRLSTVVQILRCVCRDCSGLLVTPEYLSSNNILELRGEARLKEMSEKISPSGKTNIQCSRNQHNQTAPYSKENNIKGTFTPLKKRPGDSSTESFSRQGCKNNPVYTVANYMISYKDTGGESNALSMESLYTTLLYVSEEDKKLMGIASDIDLTTYIYDAFPVVSIQARPHSYPEGRVVIDPLTKAYELIVSEAEKLSNYTERVKEVEKKATMANICRLMAQIVDGKADNDGVKMNVDSTSIKEKISGKKKLIRCFSQAKRVNSCGRSVLGACSSLKFGEIGIPERMRKGVTIEEFVILTNIEKLQKDFEEGRVSYIIKADDLRLRGRRIKVNDQVRASVTLKVGDKVSRWGRDEEDVVMFNRQPTLTRKSMQGHDCIYLPGDTIRLHMSNTTQYNADFDGDEGNGHFLQTTGSKVEGKTIISAAANISDATGAPSAGLAYNSISAAYTLTEGYYGTFRDRFIASLTREQYLNLRRTHPEMSDADIKTASRILQPPFCFGAKEKKGRKFGDHSMDINEAEAYSMMEECTETLTHTEHFDSVPDRIKRARIPLTNHERIVIEAAGKRAEDYTKVLPYSGRALFSYLFPEDFYYSKGDVLIENGIHLRGAVTKEHVGPVAKSVVHYLLKEYGSARAKAFLTDGTFLTNWFIFNDPFSIGYEDCSPPTKEIYELIARSDPTRDPATIDVKSKNPAYDEIQRTIRLEMTKAEMQIESLLSQDRNLDEYEKGRLEGDIKTVLDNGRVIGVKVGLNQLPPWEALNIMSRSKAKGDATNTAAIIAQKGQEYIRGQRPEMLLNVQANGKGTRSIFYFPENSAKLEARGLIRGSYIRGLSPAENFFHAQASRIGGISTSVNTADSGHLHRRTVKTFEDVKIGYDGSVCNAGGTVFQCSFTDGFDSSYLMNVASSRVGSVNMFADIPYLAKKLNSLNN